MIEFSKINWTDSNIYLPEKWTWIKLLVDFNIPIGLVSWLNPENIPSISFKEGEVFPISWGSYQDTDKQIKDCLWIVHNNTLHTSSISKEFISLNEVNEGGLIFENVTKKVIREHKLNTILN